MKILWAVTILLLTAIASQVQAQPAKTPRIGFLFIGTKDQPHLESFRRELRDLGYVEGKNIVIEYRYAEGKNEALPALAAELVALNLDIILTTTPNANRAALKATATIPIVSAGGGDPVVDGLAKSLAQPGGNLTGLSSSAGAGMMGKRLELLKEAVPRTSVVAMLWNPTGGPIAGRGLEEAKTAASAIGLQFRPYEINNSGDIDRAFDDLKKVRANAIFVTGGPIMNRNSRRTAELGIKLKLPSMYPTTQFVEDGGLMAYGVSFRDLYRRAATYVDKILKGRKPADLPIELPMKFELVINLKTAKQIGVTLEPNVLARADRVIK